MDARVETYLSSVYARARARTEVRAVATRRGGAIGSFVRSRGRTKDDEAFIRAMDARASVRCRA